MFLYILKWSVIYFILILLIHQLYIYFKKNLTTTKTKDYFNYSNLEYSNINSIISQNNPNNSNINNSLSNKSSNLDINLSNESSNLNNKSSNLDINLNNNNNLNSDFDISNFNNIFEKNNAFLNLDKQPLDIKDELNEFLSNLNTK
jgi:hypothetical protein